MNLIAALKRLFTKPAPTRCQQWPVNVYLFHAGAGDLMISSYQYAGDRRYSIQSSYVYRSINSTLQEVSQHKIYLN